MDLIFGGPEATCRLTRDVYPCRGKSPALVIFAISRQVAFWNCALPFCPEKRGQEDSLASKQAIARGKIAP